MLTELTELSLFFLFSPILDNLPEDQIYSQIYKYITKMSSFFRLILPIFLLLVRATTILCLQVAVKKAVPGAAFTVELIGEGQAAIISGEQPPIEEEQEVCRFFIRIIV
jgi:hypothetical protein